MIELTKDQKETYLNNGAINYHTEKLANIIDLNFCQI